LCGLFFVHFKAIAMTATRELVVPVEKSEQVPARRITAANRFLKSRQRSKPSARLSNMRNPLLMAHEVMMKPSAEQNVYCQYRLKFYKRVSANNHGVTTRFLYAQR